MIDFRFFDQHSSRDNPHDWKEKLRNPPLLWRQLAVGAFLAVPGTIAGLLVALLAPESWVPWATAGAAVGILGGFYIERE